MRHSDYNTTLKRYTRLNLIDTAAALKTAIEGAEQRQVKAVLRKTGTDDAVAGEVSIDSATEAVAAQASAETGQDVALAAPIPFSSPQQIPQRMLRETPRNGAKPSEQGGDMLMEPKASKALENKTLSDDMPDDSSGCEEAGDRIRTDDVQLGKLAFYH